MTKLIERLPGLNSTLSTWLCWAHVMNCERVTFLADLPCGISVWLASHTSRTITTSGKSAERKKRFTGPLSAQGTNQYEHYRCPGLVGLKRRRQQMLVQYADIGQVPVPLGEIEAVADDELVRD